jgi:predicted permease
LGLTLAFVSTVHAIVDGVVFKPLPYARPTELYLAHGKHRGLSTEEPVLSSKRDLDAWTAALPGVTFAAASGVVALGTLHGRPALGWSIGPGFLSVLGVVPELGREFSQRDFEGSIVPPVLLSDEFWRTACGGDRTVVERSSTSIRLGDREVTVRVVGVLPPGFVFPFRVAMGQPDVLSPLMGLDSRNRATRSLFVVARVPPAVPIVEARTRLAAAAAIVASEWPPSEGSRDSASRNAPFDDVALLALSDYLGSHERPILVTAAGVTTSLLLIALVSLSGLAMSRAHGRAREVTVRVAIGANHWHLIRRWTVEVLLLAMGAVALAGVAVGPLIAWTRNLLPGSMLFLKAVRFDERVAATLIACTAASSLLLVGVLSVASMPGVGGLTPGRSWIVRARSQARSVVVGGQVALVTMLLAGGVFMVASLGRAYATPPGFDTSNLAVVAVNAGARGMAAAAAAAEFAAWVEARSDVVAAAGWTGRLFAGRPIGEAPGYAPPGWPGAPRDVHTRGVTHGFFEVMGSSVVAGRAPEPAEWTPASPVAIVSRRAAERFWPSGAWIGQTLAFVGHDGSPRREVIGVIDEARYQSLDQDPAGTVFIPALPITAGLGGEFLLRTNVPRGQALRQILADVSDERRWTVAWAGAADELAIEGLRARRLNAWMFGTFSLWAVGVFSWGLLGLFSTEAAKRTRELGVRAALGATPGRLIRLLAEDTLRPAAAGLLLAGCAGIWLVRRFQPTLHQTASDDVGLWLLVLAAASGAAILGVVVPVWRAATAPPVDALRSD